MTMLDTAALAGLTPDVPLAKAAECYARAGFRVVPLHATLPGPACSCQEGRACGSPGKHPRITAWQREATTDLDVVRAWWRRWPNANVGLAMGGPLRFVALDVDGPRGD